jgi:hypothetical protein
MPSAWAEPRQRVVSFGEGVDHIAEVIAKSLCEAEPWRSSNFAAASGATKLH